MAESTNTESLQEKKKAPLWQVVFLTVIFLGGAAGWVGKYLDGDLEIPDELARMIPDTPPSSAFDLMIDKATREAQIEVWARGDWFEPADRTSYWPAHRNVSFNTDGSFSEAKCRIFGELSERKYVAEGEPRKWNATEMRYTGSGKIYYLLELSDGASPYIVDRNGGMIAAYAQGKVQLPMTRGHRTECPDQ